MDAPRFHEPGMHTAFGGVLDYRLDKIKDRVGGDWLDLGCADGYYSIGLHERGAATVTGIEVDPALVARAEGLEHPESVRFMLGEGERLPFDDNSFDGVLVNEVLEHVEDDAATLREVARVLRPGGTLALFGPNRWFPLEGHGARWSDTRTLSSKPVPLMPWLPKRLTSRVATARNYWPGEMVDLVTRAGLRVERRSWALARFEQYPWLPERAAAWYRSHMTTIESSPLARFFAVSTFVLARA